MVTKKQRIFLMYCIFAALYFRLLCSFNDLADLGGYIVQGIKDYELGSFMICSLII